jgi:1,4-dihydroxy-2-naphthoate octaprenyltransferase
VFVASLAIGALVTAILVVNNYRDIETDRKANKRTLAVMLGRQGARREYYLLLIVAFVVPPLLWLLFSYSPAVLLAWLTVFPAVDLARTLATATDGPTLNKTLGRTAQLGLRYSLLLSAGIVTSLWW